MARSRGTWTPEQARLMIERSRQARKLRAAQRSLEPAPLAPAQPAPDFPTSSLARVRAHVNKLHNLTDEVLSAAKPDAQRLHWLCKSLAELAELERRLAGRPLPGSRRPGRDDAQPAPLVTRRKVAPIMPTDASSSPAPGDDEGEEPPLYSEE